ncbi:uncharacterized protein BJ212DRAFT_1302209 [Suillus subaureus]|uniref:Uncharacterized protein n=1 Tax=Suillus subaureus TaxID=48587 RepID=A0A9P7JA17_9AGAM|nr:uncharacterized protein BJ212DRAFT_1302209 [Suillus subaureus]KAG1810886.1 hypothetical protein BJ212DRAFT_1302209 [Suillus subaureus]
MLIVARFVIGWAVGMMTVIILIFGSEVPPPSRGLLVGQHKYVDRDPYAKVFGLLRQSVGAGVPSHAESWEIVSGLHVDSSGPSYAPKIFCAQKGFHQMIKQVELDTQVWVTSGGAWQTVTEHSYRKYYMVNLYKDLGFTGEITIILSVTSDCCQSRNLVAAIIMDHVGRIRLLGKNISPFSGMHYRSLHSNWPCQLCDLFPENPYLIDPTPHTGNALEVGPTALANWLGILHGICVPVGDEIGVMLYFSLKWGSNLLWEDGKRNIRGFDWRGVAMAVIQTLSQELSTACPLDETFSALLWMINDWLETPVFCAAWEENTAKIVRWPQLQIILRHSIPP